MYGVSKNNCRALRYKGRCTKGFGSIRTNRVVYEVAHECIYQIHNNAAFSI